MGRIGYILYRLINFYELIIFVQCLLSWFPVSGAVRDLYDVLQRITEPFVGIFRRLIPAAAMGVDFSPMIAVIVLDIVKRWVIYL